MERLSEQLPFAAIVTLPDTVGGAELEVTFTARGPDAMLEQTEACFSHFAVAAEAGMFAGDTVDPAESLFRVVSHERDGLATRYRCAVRGVDQGAFRVLLNAVAETSRRGEALDAVGVRGRTSRRTVTRVREILSREYPGRAGVLPFKLTLSDFFFENREPVIRLEFRRELTDNAFERIRTMVEAWDQLLMSGGYLDPAHRDGDLLPEPGEFVLVEPMVIEHVIYAFQGPKESFNAVINMGVRLHRSGLRLSEVEIE